MAGLPLVTTGPVAEGQMELDASVAKDEIGAVGSCCALWEEVLSTESLCQRPQSSSRSERELDLSLQ